MAYDRNIPQPTDLISNSQADLLANFQAIDSGTTGTGTGFSRNHVTLTDGTNGGLHNRIDFYQALASPAISGFVASEYPKTVTNIELFYKNATQDMQISNSLLTAASGEGMLPGGLQIRCGGGTANNTSTTFTTAFPNACIAVVATLNTSVGTIQITAKSATAFTANSSSSGAMYYVAIGY